MQPLDVVLEERRRRARGDLRRGGGGFKGGGVGSVVAGDVQLAHLEVALAGVALKRAVSIKYISRQADGFDDAFLRVRVFLWDLKCQVLAVPGL